MEIQVRRHGNYNSSAGYRSEEDMDVRKGPWTDEEDKMLSNYITNHGEGRWNTVARCAGLKRTGKSCRLRWLNYLRPNVRRGNITLQEQLLILQLHSRWGNRWSKIAQYLPGRTDNEIKNYWRTRVQKQAKQLKCDVNSKQFRDAMRCVWIPRLMERIRAASDSPPSGQTDTFPNYYAEDHNIDIDMDIHHSSQAVHQVLDHQVNEDGSDQAYPNFTPDLSGSTVTSSLDNQVSPASDCLQNGSGSSYPGDYAGTWDLGILEDEAFGGMNTIMDGGATWWTTEGLEDLLLLQQQPMW